MKKIIYILSGVLNIILMAAWLLAKNRNQNYKKQIIHTDSHINQLNGSEFK